MVQQGELGGLPDNFVIPPLKKIEAAWRSLRKTGADKEDSRQLSFDDSAIQGFR
jgi:hypothetical protein